jgi:c-di-GMP-related signal transduction protein
MSITSFAPATDPTTPQLCLARQAIFDARGRVFGYELLYRATSEAQYASEGGDHAAASVLSTATGAVGLDVLTGRKRAFINVTRNVLLSGASLLPPKAVVVELLESVQVDREVIDVCRSLKESGYAIALDDFVAGSEAEALLPYAAFVKVDVLNTTPAERAALAARLKPRGLKLLAEKVETAEIVAASKAEGYEFFQGYFFLKPTMHVARRVPESQITYLRLLAALSRNDLTFNDLENLVKSDVSLSYRVLRTINSSAFALRREVTSIRQALIMLGQDQIRKWSAVSRRRCRWP